MPSARTEWDESGYDVVLVIHLGKADRNRGTSTRDVLIVSLLPISSEGELIVEAILTKRPPEARGMTMREGGDDVEQEVEKRIGTDNENEDVVT
jgi:hypothetical protein